MSILDKVVKASEPAVSKQKDGAFIGAGWITRADNGTEFISLDFNTLDANGKKVAITALDLAGHKMQLVRSKSKLSGLKADGTPIKDNAPDYLILVKEVVEVKA